VWAGPALLALLSIASAAAVLVLLLHGVLGHLVSQVAFCLLSLADAASDAGELTPEQPGVP
jgi:hypothetical protein